jgi:hypothetical protein
MKIKIWYSNILFEIGCWLVGYCIMWMYVLFVSTCVWYVVQCKTCSYGDTMYNPGEVQLEPCVLCTCSGDTGQLTCSHKVCPPTDDPACLKYEIPPGECCPICVEVGCFHDGVGYQRGERLRLGPCQYCYCPWGGIGALLGEVTCVNMTCLDMGCSGAVTPPGRCCPVCPGSQIDE